MIKTFKDFIEKAKKVDPILITAMPVHGNHSDPRRAKLRVESYEDADPHNDPWLSHNHNHHIGEKHQDVHNKLDMDPNKFDKHPGSKHVHKYTDWSYDINHNLLAKQTGKKKTWHKTEHHTYHDDIWNKNKKKEHYAQVAGIDRALKKSKLQHDTHVFHGTNTWHPGEQAAKHPEGHVKSAAYLSTSIDQGKAHRFAGRGGHKAHILHIHLKKGHHAMYLGSNSYHHHEKEMLLPRNTTLKIHPKPKVLSCGTHVWHAHPVDD